MDVGIIIFGIICPIGIPILALILGLCFRSEGSSDIGNISLRQENWYDKPPITGNDYTYNYIPKSEHTDDHFVEKLAAYELTEAIWKN